MMAMANHPMRVPRPIEKGRQGGEQTKGKSRMKIENCVFGGTVNIEKTLEAYRDAPRSESKTDGCQVKLTETQKAALRAVCSELGVGLSTFISRAIETQLRILPIEERLWRYEQAVVALLSSLP